MKNSERFQLRYEPEDEAKLICLAREVRRSRSDVIRILIRDAYAEMPVAEQEKEVTHEVQ